jgi:hypothetical protein
MSNELAKKRNDAYVARYRTEEDPFTKFGNEGATGIVGTLYTNVKGDWLAGRDKAIVPAGTKMLVVVPTALRGWVKFGDHGIVSAEVGLVADNYLVKHRSALGDLDESLWPVGRDGKVRDMWTQYVSVQMIEMTPPHGDATFTSTSWGGKLGLQDICGQYGRNRHLYPGAFPIVELVKKSRPSKLYGSIPGPGFNVVGWQTVENVRAGITESMQAYTPAVTSADIDDDISHLDQAGAA